MHKITKGLKKKKKGKKSKHKEDELFKPEELEAYRREHQATVSAEEGASTPAAPGQNEEWKKFIALTSGVDDILKKTQGDLDRIKSTSFFQRVPPPSEVKRKEEEQQREEAASNCVEEQRVAEASIQEAVQLGIVEVSESESEEEEDDDIFDTAYIDAIAAGEVKLAYIPESPTEEETGGDDPFDTSYAEKAILGPVVERKGKKLVPLGAAVDVLTGRVQLPTCAIQRPNSRRQVLKQRDLLLGSFDDNANSIGAQSASSPVEVKKTLLDEDTPLPDEPIDLSRTLHQIPAVPVTESKLPVDNSKKTNDILSEFDVIQNVDDEDDEDFAALAAESLAKTPVAGVPELLPVAIPAIPEETNWAAFEQPQNGSTKVEAVDEDPFDTTFAENILPGKAELKQIENEILTNDLDFDPRAADKLAQIINKVSIKVTDPAGQRESISSLDRVSESDLNLIKPIHRDLLGGSNTDLSNLNDQPLKPSDKVDEDYIEYCDPFDTSIVETAQIPGHTELKFLEKELLGDIRIVEERKSSWSDDDFDPRAVEDKERTLSRPDVLNIGSVKTVSFDLPSPKDLLTSGDDHSKVSKPLTPFYVRKSSIPEQIVDEDENSDPFDTSFVPSTAPGKTELKLIESELFDPVVERNLSISDQDFDPRDENKTQIEKVVQSIKEISQKPVDFKVEPAAVKPIDLFAVDHEDVAGKVLTPAAQSFDEISYSDPFDTSIATNIFPGKTELKLLESELIQDNLEDADFDPRSFDNHKQPVDLLDNQTNEIVILNPLNPITGGAISFNQEDEDIDPFDTSIANNIVPGKAELKVLESELM